MNSNMDSSEDKLSKALRDLAASSPQNPPDELGVRLNHAFLHHHRQRRLVRFATVATLAACLLVAFAALLARKNSSPPSIAAQPRQSVQPTMHFESSTQEPATVANNAATKRLHSHKSASGSAAEHKKEQTTASADSNEFVALPMFDPDIPVGQSRMVRLELPGSALRLVGYPVNEEVAERRVVTDVLLSQDGTPYAIRLVKTQAVQ